MRYYTGRGKYQKQLAQLLNKEISGNKEKKFPILGNFLRILNNLYYDLYDSHLGKREQMVPITAEDVEFLYRVQPTFVNLGHGDTYSVFLETVFEIFYNNEVGFELNVPGNTTMLIDDLFDIIVPHISS